jgi:hypothetical protein
LSPGPRACDLPHRVLSICVDSASGRNLTLGA